MISTRSWGKFGEMNKIIHLFSYVKNNVYSEPSVPGTMLGYKDENKRKREFAFIEPIVFETQTYKLVWNPL